MYSVYFLKKIACLYCEDFKDKLENSSLTINTSLTSVTPLGSEPLECIFLFVT